MRVFRFHAQFLASLVIQTSWYLKKLHWLLTDMITLINYRILFSQICVLNSKYENQQIVSVEMQIYFKTLELQTYAPLTVVLMIFIGKKLI